MCGACQPLFVDHHKLPFMAMLRNIRNMIKAGVSAKHHSWVLRKLMDEVCAFVYVVVVVVVVVVFNSV